MTNLLICENQIVLKWVALIITFHFPTYPHFIWVDVYVDHTHKPKKKSIQWRATERAILGISSRDHIRNEEFGSSSPRTGTTGELKGGPMSMSGCRRVVNKEKYLFYNSENGYNNTDFERPRFSMVSHSTIQYLLDLSVFVLWM